MDRPMIRTDADGQTQGRAAGLRDRLILPSRMAGLSLLRDALDLGPILLTGEAGAGKTWLWQSLAVEAMPGRSWVEVDVTPADDPASFLRMIAHSLGLGIVGPRSTRADLADFLAERSADGDRRVLVVEEAHNLTPAVAEEVRVLANRLGRPDGFAGLVLVGQTCLAMRMTTRALAAIEARLAARVHLGPVDADEAGLLLASLAPVDVERAHRDSGGNPRRLLRVAALPQARSPMARPEIEAHPAPTAPAPIAVAEARRPEPLTGPDRPPLHIEDGLIEVGWEPEDLAAPEPEPAVATITPALPKVPLVEEAVNDHYAALQAWREWADNQGRRAVAEPVSRPSPTLDPDDEDYDPDPDPDAANPHVRVDDGRDFAPFGQLFSRMARVHDTE